MSSTSLKKSIQVYGRLKPVILKGPTEESQEYNIHSFSEDSNQETLVITSKPTGDFINHKPKSHSFQFSKVFDQNADQESVFEIVAKPVVDSVLKGYNGTVFAYGQTGSGKTFTISGEPEHCSRRGIVQRSFQYIFDTIEKNLDEEFCVSLSYWEIHNEHGYDLLNPLRRINQLESLEKVILQENKEGDMQLRNLSLHLVSTFEEAMALLAVGDTNRMIAETSMNQSSSRSHCILTLYITIHEGQDSLVYKRSKLHLVDLAGSERVYKSGIDGQNLVEACHINLSLHYLEQVIVALSEPNRIHVPYRNSVMTTALKDSLGGNCLTVMMANLAIDQDNAEETISTCRFAQRVALVKNQPLVNIKKDPHKEIEMLRAEIRNLKSQLSFTSSEATDCEGDMDVCKNCFFMQKQIQHLQNDIFSLISLHQELLQCKDVEYDKNKEPHKVDSEWEVNPFTGDMFSAEQIKAFMKYVYTKKTESLCDFNGSKELLLDAENNVDKAYHRLYEIQNQILSFMKEQFQSRIQAMVNKIKPNFVIFDEKSNNPQDYHALLKEHSNQLKVLELSKTNYRAARRNIKKSQSDNYYEFMNLKHGNEFENSEENYFLGEGV